MASFAAGMTRTQRCRTCGRVSDDNVVQLAYEVLPSGSRWRGLWRRPPGMWYQLLASTDRVGVVRSRRGGGAALRHETLDHPGQALGLELAPPEAGDPLHCAVAHRWVAPGAEGELAQRAPRVLAAFHPSEHAGPCGEVVQRWQPFAFEQARQLEPIPQPEMGGDLLRASDRPAAEQVGLEDRART